MNVRREIELILKATDQATAPVKGLMGQLDALAQKHLGVGVGAIAMGAGIVAAIGVAANAMKNLVADSIKVGDTFADMSARTGIAASDLAEWDYVAQRVGTSIETFQIGMKSLAVAMGDAQDGGAEAQRTFDQLGVSYEDGSGKLRDVNDVLYDVADALQGLDSQSKRIDLAQGILGRGGIALLPALQNGSAGLKELQNRYAQLGPLTDAFASKADTASDSLLDFNIAVRNLKAAIAEPFLKPAGAIAADLATHIGSATIRMRELAAATKDDKRAAEEWAAARREAIAAGKEFIEGLDPKGVQAANQNVRAMLGTLDEMDPALAAVRVQAERFGIALQRWEWSKPTQAFVLIDRSQADIIKEVTDALNKLPEGAAKLQEEIDKISKEIGDWEPIRIPVEPVIDSPGFEGEDWSHSAMMEAMYGYTKEQQWQAEIERGLNEDRAEGAERIREQYQNMERLRDTAQEAAWYAGGALLSGLQSVGSFLGAENSRWMRDLAKIEQMYRTILAVKEAIAAVQAAASLFALLGSGGMIAGGGGGTEAPMLMGASGFVVTGGRAGIDSVPAMLMPEEMVIDRRTTRQLQRFLAMTEGGGFVSPFSMTGSGGGGATTINFNIARPVKRSDVLDLGESAYEATREYERRLIA